MAKRKAPSPVWPPPRQMKMHAERLSLDKPLAVRVKGKAPWLAAAAKQAAVVLNKAAGRPVASPRGRGARALTVCDMDSLPARAPRAVMKAEGYVLRVNRGGVLLAGADASGVFYGAQTLAQLLDRADGLALPGVTVRDWPAFPMRGVHLYLPARENLDFFRRLLDFFAACKLNTVILEIGGGMEYERHPEVNQAWAQFCRDALAYDFDTDRIPDSGKRSEEHFHPMFPKTGPVALQVSRFWRKDSTHVELAGGSWLRKDEVRRIARECAARHLEVVPEVQSLSHSYYLCCAHPEIAEQQLDPWPDTYCPSNPKSYELLFDVMDEVIEVFRPRLMHIGHDEAYTFRICPECRKRTGHDILAGDVNKVHDYLAARGIRTMMWGDKLMKLGRYGGVARREKDPVTGDAWVQPATWRARDVVAKDLLICDWYWSLDPKSERHFHEYGFEVCYGNFSPLGFKDWNERAGVPYVLGAEMSSWCAVSVDEFGHNNTFYQFVPGAEMLWSGRQRPRAEAVPLTARRTTPAVERLAEWKRWLVSDGKGRIEPVDFFSLARPLPQALAKKMKTGASLSTVLGTGNFKLLADHAGRMKKALVLDAEHPSSGAVPVGGKVKRLLLLHGTTLEGVFHKATYYSYHRNYAVVLRARVHYVDDREDSFSAVYREDIGPIEGAYASWCFRAVLAEAGNDHTLYAMEWTNPRPAVGVDSIEFSLGADATDKGEVIIAAVSAVR